MTSVGFPSSHAIAFSSHADSIQLHLLKTAKFSVVNHVSRTSSCNITGTKINVPAVSQNRVVPNKKYVWLTHRLHPVTSINPNCIDVNDTFRIIIEEDIEKARIVRCSRIQIDLQASHDLSVSQPDEVISFLNLSKESDYSFDTEKFPLARYFQDMIGIGTTPLDKLHLVYSSDFGQKSSRDEKFNFLEPIRNPERRKKFHSLFVTFVESQIAPVIAKAFPNSTTLYFQSFPCLRVVRPGEFSIGPHCDISYGFSQYNLNIYVPLTNIFGTNSLVLESSPGLEDWHTIEAQYGSFKSFYGAMCIHFTPGNLTDYTRVSLDFRIIPECLWIPDHDQFSRTGGYYAKCLKNSLADTWHCDEYSNPDSRVGFPFLN